MRVMREQRAARLTDRVAERLVGSLAPDERIAATVRATQGSVVLRISLTIAGTAVVWLGFANVQPNRSSGFELLASTVIFAAVSLLVDVLVLQRRVLILTSDRLLLCRLGWFGGIGDIKAERQRRSIRIERPERDRIVVVAEGLPSLRLRVPYYFEEPSEAIAAWAIVGR